MSIDEQIQALVASIREMREQMRIKDDDWREQMRIRDESWREEMRIKDEAWRASMEELREHVRVNHDSLHANLGELFESMQRHDSQIAQLITAARQDAEAIRALARIAEAHERRITGLEGEEQ